MCLHTSVCLCAVGFRLAVPAAILTAVDGVHLHSESQQLLPLLLHCCDSAPLAPAHIAAVPVMFGYSCDGELVADIQTATTSWGLGLQVGGSLVDVIFLCELPGPLGWSVPSFDKSWSSYFFLPAPLSHTRWNPDDIPARFWRWQRTAAAQLQKSPYPFPRQRDSLAHTLPGCSLHLVEQRWS